MEPLSAARRVARFGLFEVDFAAQELRKSGIKIKIQDQPFQILALLLERPGEIVTREEIQKRLWAGDTFVDFDLGLNSAVKKLRQALGDESDNPRFVETLYRRGYRFLAPVQGDEPATTSFSVFQQQLCQTMAMKLAITCKPASAKCRSPQVRSLQNALAFSCFFYVWVPVFGLATS